MLSFLKTNLAVSGLLAWFFIGYASGIADYKNGNTTPVWICILIVAASSVIPLVSYILVLGIREVWREFHA